MWSVVCGSDRPVKDMFSFFLLAFQGRVSLWSHPRTRPVHQGGLELRDPPLSLPPSLLPSLPPFLPLSPYLLLLGVFETGLNIDW